MDNFLGAISGMIIPILVVVGIVIRMVNAVSKKTPPPQHPPGRQPGGAPQNTYRPPMAGPAQTRTVPVMTGSDRPPAPERPFITEGGRLNRQTLEGSTLEGKPLNRETLEGYSLENRPSLEGRRLDRQTLEGGNTPFERTFGERTSVENRMEGTITPAPYHISRIAKNTGKGQSRRKSIFMPSRGTLVQGIIYAEILGKPGGRRASR